MQLIDFRKDTCEVYIWAYYGQDCNNPESEAQWVVTHYFVDWGVIKAEQVKYIAWEDRETATYSPTSIDQGNIPSVILDNLLNCVTGDNFDYEKLVLCHPIDWKVLVESWTNTWDPLQVATRRYIILSTGALYTWDVSELEDCGAEKYDIQVKTFCDEGENILGTLVFNLSSWTPVLETILYYNNWLPHTPVNPVEWACLISSVEYNTVKHYSTTTSLTIPTDSVHSISYQVIWAPADIQIGTDIVTYPVTSTWFDEATSLINKEYIFTPSAWWTVIIRTIN